MKRMQHADVEIKQFMTQAAVQTAHKKYFPDWLHWLDYVEEYVIEVNGIDKKYYRRDQVKKIFEWVSRIKSIPSAPAFCYLLGDFVLKMNCVWLMPNDYIIGKNKWLKTVRQWQPADYGRHHEIPDEAWATYQAFIDSMMR